MVYCGLLLVGLSRIAWVREIEMPNAALHVSSTMSKFGPFNGIQFQPYRESAKSKCTLQPYMHTDTSDKSIVHAYGSHAAMRMRGHRRMLKPNNHPARALALRLAFVLTPPTW